MMNIYLFWKDTFYLLLAPSSSESRRIKTLSHPDLHLDNVFVDPNTREITDIIDWQSTAISEIFFQRESPGMLEPVPTQKESGRNNEYPAGDNGNIPDSLSYYTECIKTLHPIRSAIINEDYRSVRVNPVSFITGSWNRGDVVSLRNAMIAVAAQWNDFAPEGTTCPIEFSKQELEKHQFEIDNLDSVSRIMHALQDIHLIPVGGMVSPDYYDTARSINKQYKQMFIDLAQDDEERELHGRRGHIRNPRLLSSMLVHFCWTPSCYLASNSR